MANIRVRRTKADTAKFKQRRVAKQLAAAKKKAGKKEATDKKVSTFLD
jgi:hypothetical protein